MATEEEVAAGLLDWINSLAVSSPVSSIDHLADGAVLWNVLQRIDALSFPGSLPEELDSSQWSTKWANLKHIHDALSIFLVEECSQRLPLPSGAPDLKAIAQHASLHDTVALLKLLVIAAINCNERIAFLTQMQELNELTQQVLMATAQEAGEDERSEEDPESRPRSSRSAHSPVEVQSTPKTPERSKPGLDFDLASEERLGRVLADNNRLALEKRDVERQLDDAYARHERLQASLERTQEELKETNDRLTAVLAGRGEGINRQDKQSDTIIAALEARATAAETELEELRKSNELLKVRVERTQKLQDDYDEIKIDRDRLSRKANAADKYKQKLEASASLEKENETLRDRISELQTQVRQSDSRSLSTSDLQREIDEYRRLLPSIEQERHELNEMKKRLEVDYYGLEARYHDSLEELRRNQQSVEDLQGRLRDYEDGVAPAATTPQASHDVGQDLDRDEADFADAEAKLTAALVNGESEDAGEAGISEDELKAIMSAMRAQAQAGSTNERESGTRAQKKLLVAVERSRSKNKELVEHVKQQSELIHHLQEKVKMPPLPIPPAKEEKKETPPTTPPKEETRQAERSYTPAGSDAESQLEDALRKNANLNRELRLMASAWHEQQKRLASGGMISIRPRTGAEPKSFLGKQRNLIDAIALGGRRA